MHEPDTGTGCSYTGPVLTAECVRRRTATAGRRQPDDVHRSRRRIAATTTSTTTRSSGSATRATAARIRPREGRGPQRRRRHARRQGVAAEEPARATRRTSSTTSTRATTPRRRATTASTTWPPSSRTSPRRSRPPEQTWGYQRRAATMLGYQQTSYVTFAPLVDPPDRPDLPGAERQHVDPERGQRRQGGRRALEGVGPRGRQRAQRPARRPEGEQRAARASTVADKKITVSLGTNATGAITSTAAAGHRRHQRLARGLGARRGEQVPHERRRRRRRAERRLAAQRPAEGAADDQARPAGPVDPPDRQRQGQAAGPEGRRLPLLPGARRRDRHLGRLPGVDGAPGAQLRDRRHRPRRYVDNLDIFILPFINADGGTHSIYDSPRRTNMSRWCEDTTMYPRT